MHIFTHTINCHQLLCRDHKIVLHSWSMTWIEIQGHLSRCVSRALIFLFLRSFHWVIPCIVQHLLWSNWVIGVSYKDHSLFLTRSLLLLIYLSFRFVIPWHLQIPLREEPLRDVPTDITVSQFSASRDVQSSWRQFRCNPCPSISSNFGSSAGNAGLCYRVGAGLVSKRGHVGSNSSQFTNYVLFLLTEIDFSHDCFSNSLIFCHIKFSIGHIVGSI